MSDLLTERESLRLHLADLEVFLAGAAYRGWESARKRQLSVIEEVIVELDPTDRKDEIESFKLRGERRLLQDLENQFQDVRETLRNRLDEIEELLQPNAANKETNDK